MADQANLPAWAQRLHGSQVAALEAEGEETTLAELVLRSHSLLMTELLRIQQHLGIPGSGDEPEV